MIRQTSTLGTPKEKPPPLLEKDDGPQLGTKTVLRPQQPVLLQRRRNGCSCINPNQNQN